mmetsp:Transcript_2848/g.5868  ORF Transcript_2848/g.5868 Transcript_2848/m.5868 type:complete len:243 (-) Transcript_2848:274-1002(-)
MKNNTKVPPAFEIIRHKFPPLQPLFIRNLCVPESRKVTYVEAVPVHLPLHLIAVPYLPLHVDLVVYGKVVELLGLTGSFACISQRPPLGYHVDQAALPNVASTYKGHLPSIRFRQSLHINRTSHKVNPPNKRICDSLIRLVAVIARVRRHRVKYLVNHVARTSDRGGDDRGWDDGGGGLHYTPATGLAARSGLYYLAPFRALPRPRTFRDHSSHLRTQLRNLYNRFRGAGVGVGIVVGAGQG